MKKTKNTMFRRFREFKKYHIELDSSEFILSILLTIIILFLAIIVKAYDNILLLKESIKAILSAFIGGYIALTGFVLSGIAIITSLFSKEQLVVIEKDEPQKLIGILVSFEYLAFLSSISAICLSLIYVGFDVPYNIIGCTSFYVFSAIIIFHILYTLFYSVSLCGNCIRIYNISLSAERIISLEREVKELQQKIEEKTNHKT